MRTFAAIRAGLGDVHVLLYNAGSGVFADFESIKPEQFEGSWRVNAYGALRTAGDPRSEGREQRLHRVHRGYGLAARRTQVRGLRSGIRFILST